MVEHAANGRVPIEDHLRTDPVVWLSTIRPDGRPHVVPVWFLWDGRAIHFYSKPGAQKVRNLRVNPSAMLAVGEPDEEFDVELIEGAADVLDQPTSSVMPPEHVAKYSALMAKVGLSPDTYVQTYSQPVRITPTRFLGYGGRGWQDPAAADADVTAHLWLGRDAQAPAPALPAAATALVGAVRERGRAPGIALMALEE
ncbi:MAG: pyridoxamine 5'-phosphate oxidase family protein [Chloroflexota bacterium]|nr:pyridoxamine 5'-phosphate oxidase family protein [Chloroflexota bacterium]